MAEYGAIRRTPTSSIVSPWLNAREAAAYCGFSESTIHEKTRQGRLRARRDTGNRRWHVEDLDEWMTTNPPPTRERE